MTTIGRRENKSYSLFRTSSVSLFVPRNPTKRCIDDTLDEILKTCCEIWFTFALNAACASPKSQNKRRHLKALEGNRVKGVRGKAGRPSPDERKWKDVKKNYAQLMCESKIFSIVSPSSPACQRSSLGVLVGTCHCLVGDEKWEVCTWMTTRVPLVVIVSPVIVVIAAIVVAPSKLAWPTTTCTSESTLASL
jgi:hypothetical protein